MNKNLKKLLPIIAMFVFSVTAASVTFYFSSKISKRPGIFQQSPYESPDPSEGPGNTCGGIAMCNGTMEYTCNGPAGIEMYGELSANPNNTYNGPCCMNCESGVCTSQASWSGTCTGSGSCTISNIDCYGTGRNLICRPVNEEAAINELCF